MKLGWWRRKRDRERVVFEEIIKANYRPNIGRVPRGELPVICPRPADFEEKA